MMKARFSLTCLFLALSALTSQSQTVTPFEGTVPVRNINTRKLLAVMNGTAQVPQGQNLFVVVAAHRGFWRNKPELSLDAIQAAWDAGVEAVEVDVRIASTHVMPYDGTQTGTRLYTGDELVLSHDECLSRQTTLTNSLRSGNDGINVNKDNACSGSGYNVTTFQAGHLRDRTGKDSGLQPPTLIQVYNLLATYQSCNNGTLTGPVLILDLKDKDNVYASGTHSQDYLAWNDYHLALQEITQSHMPLCGTPAVVFKMKAAVHLPSPEAVTNQANALKLHNPTIYPIGTLVLTINPEDANNTVPCAQEVDREDSEDESCDQPAYQPAGSKLATLLSSPTSTLINQFELVPNSYNDGASEYVGNPLQTFATYYQPSYYPEGVTTRKAKCCQMASLNHAQAIANNTTIDNRGILEFATNYLNADYTEFRTTTITSDNLSETLNYLNSLSARDVTQIQ